MTFARRIALVFPLVCFLISSPCLSVCDVDQVSSGKGHVLALKEDGTVWSWGLNDQGQLGDGTLITSDTPTQMLFLPGSFIRVAANLSNSTAIRNDGTVWTWGKKSGNKPMGIRAQFS